jgi:hypothetical protein
MKISQLLNKPTPTVANLVKKYKVTAEEVQAQLRRGIQVEMEHTRNPQVAREIALDHLGEDLHYYEKLRKIEKTSIKESTLLELFALNKVPDGVTGPELISDSPSLTAYVFAVDNIKYELALHLEGAEVEITFSDETGAAGITHAGNATKVFWAVAKGLVDYLKNHPSVSTITFVAYNDEPSCIRLYNLLSQRLAQHLGWYVTKKHRDNYVKWCVTKEQNKQSLAEGRSTSVIVVDVQPAYAQGASRSNQKLFERIIQFVNKQTGPVLMFVNAEDQGMSRDTVAEIKAYWEDVIRGEEWDPEDYDDTPIDWSRFQIKDKGFGFFRSFIDLGIEDKTIIRLIRLMYQNRVNDSRELFGGKDSANYATRFEQFIGPEFKPWMLSDGIYVNWTSVAQLKRFSGSYIVGGGKNECLKEVELLMSSFNIKAQRIESMVY